MAGRVVGIDFGTSTTLIAERVDETLPRVVPIGDVTTWMPSVLGIADDGSLVAGESAQRLGAGRTVRSIKSALTAGQNEVSSPAGTVSVPDGIRTLVAEALRRAEERSPGLFEDSEIFVGCPALWTGFERRLLV